MNRITSACQNTTNQALHNRVRELNPKYNNRPKIPIPHIPPQPESESEEDEPPTLNLNNLATD